MTSSSLKKAIHDRQLVPFVGAGLSAAVKRGLFPTWPQLIDYLARELDSEGKADDASITRGYLGKGRPIEAAGAAYSGLGKRHFNEILRRHFDIEQPTDVNLSSVNALWRLNPHLVITTNYDSVLSWANPSARRICNHQQSELAIMNQRDPSSPPWIWHLHGHIEQADTIILAPEQYEELYRDREGTKKDYRAALFQFRNIVSSKTLLFVGYGLSDDYIMPELKQLMDILAGVSAPKYALVRKGSGQREPLWNEYQIELIEFEDFGRPFTEAIERLAAEAGSGPYQHAMSAAKAGFTDVKMSEDDAAAFVQKTSPWTLKTPEAVEKLRDALRTVPSALGFWKLAALLAQDDRCNEAIEALRAGDQLGATNKAQERGLYAGLVFLKQGTLEKAETELRTYLKTGSREFQGIAYDMLATLKRGSDVVSAEDLYKASLAVKLREDDLLGQSITLGNLGRLLMYQNRFAEAAQSFRKNLVLTEKIDNQKSLGIVKNNLAESLIGMGNFEESCQLLLDVSKSTASSPKDHGYALALMSEMYVLKGDIEQAKSAADLAREAFEQARTFDALYVVEEVDGLIATAHKWFRTAQTRFSVLDEMLREPAQSLLRIYRYRRRAKVSAEVGSLENVLRHLEAAKRIAHEQRIPLLAELEKDEDILRRQVIGVVPEVDEGQTWRIYWQNRLPLPLARALPIETSDPMGTFLFAEQLADLLALILRAGRGGVENESDAERPVSLGRKIGLLRQMGVKDVLQQDSVPEDSILEILGAIVALRNAYVHNRIEKMTREEVAKQARGLLDKLVRFASRELEVYELHNEGKRIPLVGNLVDIDDQSDIHARLGTVFSDVTQFRSLIIS